MAHPWHHAISSARRFGGVPEDYLPIHQWFDASKEMGSDFRHRALRHHAQGIYEAERVFGVTLGVRVSGPGERIRCKDVPVRLIGEQHVREDLGRIPTLWDWLQNIEPQPWMNRNRPLSAALEQEPGAELKLVVDDSGERTIEMRTHDGRRLEQRL